MSQVHIAGLDVQIGPLLRQRCAWCDRILIDHDLRRVLTQLNPDGSAPERPATWGVGELVLVDEGYQALVDHKDGDQLPLNACVPVAVIGAPP